MSARPLPRPPCLRDNTTRFDRLANPEIMIKLFGIPNCDRVRKARHWLDHRGICYVFHDFRKDGLEAGQLADWINVAGWDTLLNRKGSSWRQLTTEQRERIDATRALALMLAQPTLIKRPVLETGKHLEIGFDADRYTTLFKG